MITRSRLAEFLTFRPHIRSSFGCLKSNNVNKEMWQVWFAATKSLQSFCFVAVLLAIIVIRILEDTPGSRNQPWGNFIFHEKVTTEDSVLCEMCWCFTAGEILPKVVGRTEGFYSHPRDHWILEDWIWFFIGIPITKSLPNFPDTVV